jgi:hypothetical protein
MSIIIRDETANAAVLTIDNNGNMTFGDGTPIAAVTIAGQEIIDGNGFIVHGLGSCSVNGVSGSVNVGIRHVATIPTTLAGRLPTVQLDTQYPAMSYSLDFDTSTDPPTGIESSSPVYGQVVHTLLSAQPGSFSIVNNNHASLLLTQPGQYHDSSLDTAECGYRWI